MSLGLGLGLNLIRGKQYDSLGVRTLADMSFVNNATNTFSRGSSAFHPRTGVTTIANTRRRANWRVKGVNYNIDLNEQNRTNLVLRSNALSTAPWTVANLSSVVQDQTDAYGNANTAWKLTDTTDGSPTPHVIYQQLSKAASSLTYTGQCEFKILTANTRFKLQIDIIAAVAGIRVIVDSSGIITGQEAFGAGWTLTKAYVKSLGNGWYRAVVSGTSDANNNIRHRPTICDQTNNETYKGASNRSVVVARCQLEQSQHGSSYIETTSATAGRAVEGGAWTLPYTLGPESTLVGIGVPHMWEDNYSQPATFHVLTRAGTDEHGIYSVANGATRTVQAFSRDAAGARTAQWLAGASVYTMDTATVQTTRRNAGNLTLFNNGTQVANQAIVTAPWINVTSIGIGATPALTSPYHGWVGIFIINRALTNDEVSAVSALLRSGAFI